jgi:hypothetical protein
VGPCTTLGQLTLALLVLGVLADDANDTLAMNDLALVADRFYGCTDLHEKLQFLVLTYAACLLVAVHNATAVQVIRAQLNGDSVTGEDADEVLAHSARNMRQYLVLVLELYLEQRIGQRLNDYRHHFNSIFLRQTISFDRKPCLTAQGCSICFASLQLVSWASGVSTRTKAKEDGGRNTHHLQDYRKNRD